jgi:hypothetical protein
VGTHEHDLHPEREEPVRRPTELGRGAALVGDVEQLAERVRPEDEEGVVCEVDVTSTVLQTTWGIAISKSSLVRRKASGSRQ